LAFVGVANAGSKLHTPVLSDPEAELRVRDFFDEARDRAALDALLQIGPLRCYEVGAAGELCEWQLARSDAGWRPVARALGTRDRISVLCVVPANGSAREAGACSAHNRRSNRDRWKVQRRPGNKRRVDIKRSREHGQRLAAGMLAEAKTLVELSRLMGESPSECAASASGRVCLWRTTSHTWGHGTLAMIGDIDNIKKVRLECTLPNGIAPRSANACSIEEGV
jgi:hypothetical protein